MKYFILSLATVAFFSCNNTNNNTDTNKTTAHNSIKDPVCGMTEAPDMKWTDYAVNGTDTTWFCSPHCKDQYEKHPEKYTK